MALITDGRFSGGTRGACIGHVSPEAAAGGPIGLLRDGDIVTSTSRRGGWMWTCRTGSWSPPGRVAAPEQALTGWLKRYTAMVTSGSQGAVLQV